MNRYLPLLLIAAIVAVAGCTSSPAAVGFANEPSITVTSSPTTAIISTPETISWSIVAPPQETTHTSIHFGPASVPNPTKPSDYPSSSAYLSGSLPGSFSSEITPTAAGTLYLRAHVILANNDHLWSTEQTIAVSALPAELENDLAGSEQELDQLPAQ